MGDHRDFKFGVMVDHRLQTSNCPWKGCGHVTWPNL